MRHIFSAIGALALGAGAMYYFDPQMGRRRRAELTDKFEHLSHETRRFADVQLKHTRDRSQGLLAAVRSQFGESEALSDEQLNARIRSKLGHRVSYPGAIETRVEQGRVTLRGHILAAEEPTLTALLEAMPQVKSVENHLQRHDSAGNEPSLQGEPHRLHSEGTAMSAIVSAVAVAGGLVLGAKLLKGAAGMPLLLSLLAAGGAGVKRLAHEDEASKEPKFIERRETPRTATTLSGDDIPGDRGSTVLH